jgi:hypothetical protein
MTCSSDPPPPRRSDQDRRAGRRLGLRWELRGETLPGASNDLHTANPHLRLTHLVLCQAGPAFFRGVL